MLTLSYIKWAAEECERQQSGELSVSNLCNALHYAREMRRIFDIEDIKILGHLVEPEKNKNGFRTVPVHFADLSFAISAENIPNAMTQLLAHGSDLTVTEWYRAFQEIHPFVDGNGRVGAILFNIKNDSLNNPIAPPDIFETRYL